MKKIIFILTLACSTSAFAHFFWIETSSKGGIGQAHDIQVYFGEFGSGVVEKTDGKVFQNAKHFTLWVIDEKGRKMQLETTANENYYSASFTPKADGRYTIVVDHKKYSVLDFTEYDYGIFKPEYHSIAKVDVGATTMAHTAAVNPKSITIVDHTTTADLVKLQVLYQGKPLAETEVTVFMKQDWSKKIKTDKNGMFTFSTPFAARYVIEATDEDKTPGTYNEAAYQFTWHCAVYTIN